MSADGGDAEAERPNLLDRTVDKVDLWHREIPPLAIVHGVVKKFGEDRGGQLAMLLAYRGFFSVFPLLLAFVAIVGLLLDGNPELQADLIDSTLSEIPVIGDEIAKSADGLTGNVTVVAGSILLSLWAGLGLLEMLGESLNTVWGVPLFDRPPWIVRRLRSLPAAFLIGGCLVLSGGSAWIVRSDSSLVAQIAGVLLPFLAGALCYLGLHWILCARKVPFVAQLPGATFVGLAWLALQVVGAWYVDRYVLQSSDTYGAFVVVFGLLSWSYLLGLLYLYGNELASVLYLRRWPRSITGRNLTDVDQHALKRNVEREVRVRGVDLEVDVPRLPR